MRDAFLASGTCAEAPIDSKPPRIEHANLFSFSVWPKETEYDKTKNSVRVADNKNVFITVTFLVNNKFN
jgi:hypothetical protein